MPESWNWEERGVEWGGWPGRPEFVEATYYLFQVSGEAVLWLMAALME